MFDVLKKMNFGEKWIHWIISIFQTIYIAVLINGSPTQEFKPTRGLRQGDPLSPLLFNIVGQILHKLIHTAEIMGKFKEVHIGRKGKTFTHLQFANDNMLFVNADDESITNIKIVLQTFQLLSGLKINFEKSELLSLH